MYPPQQYAIPPGLQTKDFRKAWSDSKNIEFPNNYPSKMPANKEKKKKDDESPKELSFLQNMSEYFSNTSLHGFKYIAETGRHPVEKCLWVIFCTAAICGTVYFLYPVFFKYFNTPVLTSVESTNTPIWEVEFPAVTICNVNKAIKSRIDDAMDRFPWNQYSLEVIEKLVDLLARAGTSYDFPSYGPGMDKQLREILAKHYNASQRLMRKVQPARAEMMLKCWWQGKEVNCTSITNVRLTEHGHCSSFNSMNLEDAVKPDEGDFGDGGPAPSTTSADDIRKVNSAGAGMGLVVLLNPQINEYWATADSFYGFKVLVHSPGDFAYVNQRSFVIAPGQEVFAAVTPVEVKSSEDVRGVKINLRKCRFDDEDVLKMFNAYTYANCIMECKIQSFKDACGCVTYIYSITHTTEDICNYDQLQCVAKNFKKFLSLTDGSPEIKKLGEGMNCDCLSSCDDTTYSTEVTSSLFPLQIEEIYPQINTSTNINASSLILLRVYFRTLSYLQFKRNIIYTWTDLVAAFGGVVGLFLGFSIVSGVEVIYFFTVRPLVACARKRKKKQAKSSVTATILQDQYGPYTIYNGKKHRLFNDMFMEANQIIDHGITGNSGYKNGSHYIP